MTPRQRLDEAAVVEALRALARNEADVAPPPHLEARVMNAWDQEHARRARPHVRRAFWATAAIAAGIVLVATMVMMKSIDSQPIVLPDAPHHVASADTRRFVVGPTDDVRAEPAPVGAHRATRASTTSVRPAARAEPVTFVVVGEPPTTGEPVRVVRMRVAASRLAAFGFQPVAQNDSVDVELLVGDDGVARGLRLGM
jgi:hypothetical protein